MNQIKSQNPDILEYDSRLMGDFQNKNFKEIQIKENQEFIQPFSDIQSSRRWTSGQQKLFTPNSSIFNSRLEPRKRFGDPMANNNTTNTGLVDIQIMPDAEKRNLPPLTED